MQKLALALIGVTSSYGYDEEHLRKRCMTMCKSHPKNQVQTDAQCERYKSRRPMNLQSICIEQFRNGINFGCTMGCNEKVCAAVSQSPTVISRRDEICRQYKSAMPRPLLSDTCKENFIAGVESRCNDMTSWMTTERKRLSADEAEEARKEHLAALQAAVDAMANQEIYEEEIAMLETEPVAVEEPVAVPEPVDDKKKSAVRGGNVVEVEEPAVAAVVEEPAAVETVAAAAAVVEEPAAVQETVPEVVAEAPAAVVAVVEDAPVVEEKKVDDVVVPEPVLPVEEQQ